MALAFLSALPRVPMRTPPQAVEVTVDVAPVAAARPTDSAPPAQSVIGEQMPSAEPRQAAMSEPLPPDPAAPEIATRTMAPVRDAPAPPGPPQRQQAAAEPDPPPPPALEQILPPVETPPAPTARDIAGATPRTTSPPAAKAPTPRAPVPKPNAPHEERLAHAVPAPAAAAAGDGRSSKAREDYLWQIIRKLSQYKARTTARPASEQGLVVLRLTVARDGRLVDLALARSSGSPALDRGVMDACRQAAPFAPPPAEIASDPYTLLVPIAYEHDH